jgi:competence protein ComEC
VTAPVCLPLAELLTYVAGWPCRWLVFVADRFGELSGAAVPWLGGVTGGLLLAAVAALLVWSLRVRRSRAVVLAATVVLLSVQWPVRWVVSDWPQPGALLVGCDVGQGDALVVPVAPNSAVVVDTGPEPIAIDRCLHDLGIADIPLLVLTHMHLDHVGGLAGAVRGRSVGAVVTGPSLDPEIGTHLVEGVLRQRSLSMGTLTQHEVITVGAARIEVLGPRSAFHDTRSDPNNSSVALRVTVGGVRLLLAADMELEAQRELLDEGVDVRADVLKVPHHGSAYSDAQFLAAVGARVGVISVGAHNDYGHPAPSLLHTLVGLGISARRTDLDGDVAFLPAGAGVRAVVRGTANSELGLAPLRQRTPLPSASVAGVRMGPCPPERSAPTTSPTQCPEWYWSSATRSCSSRGPSARSPPQSGAAIRR